MSSILNNLMKTFGGTSYTSSTLAAAAEVVDDVPDESPIAVPPLSDLVDRKPKNTGQDEKKKTLKKLPARDSQSKGKSRVNKKKRQSRAGLSSILTPPQQNQQQQQPKHIVSSSKSKTKKTKPRTPASSPLQLRPNPHLGGIVLPLLTLPSAAAPAPTSPSTSNERRTVQFKRDQSAAMMRVVLNGSLATVAAMEAEQNVRKGIRTRQQHLLKDTHPTRDRRLGSHHGVGVRGADRRRKGASLMQPRRGF